MNANLEFPAGSPAPLPSPPTGSRTELRAPARPPTPTTARTPPQPRDPVEPAKPKRDRNAPHARRASWARSLAPVARYGVGIALLGVPLLLALTGPWFVPDELTRGIPFAGGAEHPLGTDFVGRDVWHQVLLGGRSVVLIALTATALAYLAGIPMALAAATTRHRWVDEALMRPLDLLLAVPSLLLLILVAGIADAGTGIVILAVALVNLPDVVRVVRAAALEIAGRPAVEALRLQGESRTYIAVRYIGRSLLRTLAADVGIRLTAALYLVASASFLGIGVSPDAADWAVMVDRNRAGLFLQPWGVVVPALLIVALTVGLNLIFDNATDRRHR
ncbi:ABC transporter permease [Nocardia asteroides]|uniref:ABC transporter permease n=1 Tax=Nocardia asteroides TaxID=1824 RepID=UPI001E4901EA|nr:ABC transporter permease [Nocardia asteroides]UGT63093.1 ABC transporter permease [Nocardia asteroides]